MRLSRIIVFVFQFATIGLAAAFVILYLFPQFRPDFAQTPQVVEVREAPLNAPPLVPGVTSYADAVEKAAPAVVNIFTRKVVTETPERALSPRFRGLPGETPRQRLETSLGSGVIISTEGYILTNHHVVAGADAIEVALRDGRTTTATVVGTDPETDLAVLRIELPDLKAMVLGHSRTLRVGDVVLAIGNPFGVGQTVTSGIVSATGRDMLGINTFENFIQTDAAINPGNSGGALITTDGNLVGINTAIFSQSGGSEGIGFAIPVDLARKVLAQIIEKGHVVRGWLGVAIQNLTPALARSFDLKSTEGVIISGIMADGPAERAGLQPGDVITRIDNHPVDNVRTALNLISDNPPGTAITIEGIRNGRPFKVIATVGERPQAVPAQPAAGTRN